MALPLFSYHFYLAVSRFFVSFVYCLLFDVANISTFANIANYQYAFMLIMSIN